MMEINMGSHGTICAEGRQIPYAMSAAMVMLEYCKEKRAIRRRLYYRYGIKCWRYADGKLDRENMVATFSGDGFFAERLDPETNPGDLAVIELDFGLKYLWTSRWLVVVEMVECLRKENWADRWEEWKIKDTGRRIAIVHGVVEDIAPPIVERYIAEWGSEKPTRKAGE